MPDFYQHRHISTMHHLADFPLEEQEKALEEHVKLRPLTLALPALYAEVTRPALQGIVDELKRVRYLEEVVVSMNRMNAEEFVHAKAFFSQLPQRVRIIWNDGPRMEAIYDVLEEAQLTSYVPGKGCNIWMAYGYAMARGTSRVIVSHDTDIISYHREMLARLCMPAVHVNMAYEFSKSYYGRVTDRMYGRVTRLFVMPLLRSMMHTVGHHDLLDYLEAFRYPLSGEFAVSLELAGTLSLPGDWGLEIGMLCEAYRNTSTRRICQVDLGVNFEHKHQYLGAECDEVKPLADKGLMKMARDIALTLFSSLGSEGVVLGRSLLKAVGLTYERMAKEMIVRYQDDALINGLDYFRDEESEAVGAFSRVLAVAAEEFLEVGYQSLQIPNWNRTNSALPELRERLLEAVEGDNADGF
jgi:glucosyl-3-phosphoglycerate synthase